jgi:hypothetical protein
LQTSLSSNIASALCLLLSSVVLSMVRPSMPAGYVGEDCGWKYAFSFLHGLWSKICVQFSSRAIVFDVRSCPARQTAMIMVKYAFGFVTCDVVWCCGPVNQTAMGLCKWLSDCEGHSVGFLFSI